MTEETIKVAFYLANQGAAGVDLSRPEEGNPGIGGTEFNFITLAYYLKKLCGFEVTLLANDIRSLPATVTGIKVDGIEAAVDWCDKNGVNVFLYRPTDRDDCVRALQLIDERQLRSIAWAHNTPFLTVDRIRKSHFVKRMICVSVEQYDMMRDHPIIKKLGVILNGFDPSAYLTPEILNKERSVVFLGSLEPAKGFHVLAKRWRNIVAAVPDAKLQVIGTGQLYDRNAKLGPLGVADSRYEEKSLVPFLCEADGQVMPSVTFLGLLGREKIPYLQAARIGVVNPSGKTENCPGSAIEFQACGTPVVSCARWGLLDTVEHNHTGYLAKDYNEFEAAIISLLSDDDAARRLGSNGPDHVRQKFDCHKICQQWIELFNDVAQDRPCSILPITQNPSYKAKTTREYIRRLKATFPVLWFTLPSYAGIRIALRRVARRLRKTDSLQPK